MRFPITFLLALLVLARPAQPQLAIDPEEVPVVTYDSDEEMFTFSWLAKMGRTYFIQHSLDLRTWNYLPEIHSGDGFMIPYHSYRSEDIGFLRLQIAGISATDPYAADFDGDKVGNWDEIRNQTDPMDFADADGDGMSDDWEKLYGLAPNNPSDASQVSLGGGLTNREKYDRNLNPRRSDSDGDGLSDVDEIQNGTDPRLITVCTDFWVIASWDEGIENPTKADLLWTPPADPVVTALRVEWRYDDQISWQSLAQKSPGANSHRVENLLAKRLYQFRVVAITAPSEYPTPADSYEVPVEPEIERRTTYSTIRFPGFYDSGEAIPTKYLTRTDEYYSYTSLSVPGGHSTTSHGLAILHFDPVTRSESLNGNRSWSSSQANSTSYSDSIASEEKVPYFSPPGVTPTAYTNIMRLENYENSDLSRDWNESASWNLTTDPTIMQNVLGSITLLEEGENFSATLQAGGDWVGNLYSDQWDSTYGGFDCYRIDAGHLTLNSFSETRSVYHYEEPGWVEDHWAYRKHTDVFTTAQLIEIAVGNLQSVAQTPEQWEAPFYENLGYFASSGYGARWGEWGGYMQAPMSADFSLYLARWVLDNDELGFGVSRSQFKVKVNPSAVNHDLLLVHRFEPAPLENGEHPPAEFRLITVPIEAGATESEVFLIDPSDPAAFAARRNGTHYLGILPPVDIDIIYPASSELSDAKEDTGDGGYVSVRRLVDGQDVTPVTMLVVRAVGGAQSGWKTRLKFSPGDRYKIYSDEGRAQEVTSESTEFDATQETTLYFQGLKKSQSRGGEEIKMQVSLGSQWYDGDSLKCTVVQSEFLFQVKAFIPYAWTDGEDLWYVPNQNNPMAGKVAKGDDRTFRNAYSDDVPQASGGHFEDAPFRVCQTVVITPFKELHDAPDIQVKRKLMTAPTSDHYVKSTSVDTSEMSLHYGYIALSGNPSSSGKPPSSREHYDFVKREGRVAEVTVEGAGKDGALGYIGSSNVPYTSVIDDIHWRLYLKVWSESDPLHPTVEFGGRHDRYPAYEIIVIQSDGTYKDIHRVPPNPGDRPGPDSLDDSHGRNVGRSDTVE